MATTVDEGFRTLLGRLTPAGSESDAAKSHRASIEAALKGAFQISRFWRTGSFGHGTSVRWFSDVDYFASVPDKYAKPSSAVLLQSVFQVLDGRFPRTGVRINSPAIVVPFGQNGLETTEVVPANLVDMDRLDHLVHDIASPTGGWMRSSPDAHNDLVDSQDARLKGKLKPLIRFMKAWKYFANVPISSFYLEMRTTAYAMGETTIVYAIDVARVADLLCTEGLVPLADPLGISGWITATDSPADYAMAERCALDATVHARLARKAEYDGNLRDAFRWWNSFFTGHFPPFE